jgi:hypothetical protein
MFGRIVAALVALVLTGIAAGWSGPAAAIPNPTAPALTLRIDPASQAATIDEATKCGLNFTGEIRVDKLPVEKVVVELSAMVDTGWPASISPSTMVITDTAAHTFNVNVTVHEACPADDIGHLTVTATSAGKGYSVSEQANATITVNPYYRVALDADGAYQEVRPDVAGSFKLKITNRGNAVDSYAFEITNLMELRNMGWNVELDKTSVSKLHPFDEAEFTLTAVPPKAWSWDIWISKPVVITVKATSLNAQESGTAITQDFPVVIYQKGFNTPILNLISGVSVALVAVAIAGVIMWRLRMRRRRNAQSPGEPVRR